MSFARSSSMPRLARAGALAAGLALGMAAPAARALPVLHTVNGSLSSLRADVTAQLAIVANRSNGARENGSASVSGQLASTPQGTIGVDWGDPTWSGSLDVAAGDANIQNPSPGSASGIATIRFFNLINVNFNLNVAVDTIDIGLASDFSAPTNPAPPGPGPWSGSDLTDILLSARLDFGATGPFGISIQQNDILIGPSAVPDVSLTGTLSRTGGDPGTGTRLELPFAGLSIGLGPQPTSNIPTPGCELLAFVCVLDITSVDVTLTSLTLSNVRGVIVADSDTPITFVPEPNTLALLGLGLAALARSGARRPRPARD